MVSALSIDKRLEIEGDFEAEELVQTDPNRSGMRIRRGFCDELSHNFRIARNALKVKEFQTMYLFYILQGITLPQFYQFLYYFYTDVLLFSQFTYGMVAFVGGILLTVGVLTY